MIDRASPSGRRRPAALVACFVVLSLMAGITLAPGDVSVVAAGAKRSAAYAQDRVIVGYTQRASGRKRRAAVRSVGLSSMKAASPIAKDTVVVKLKAGQSVKEAIEEIGEQPGVAYVEPDYRVSVAVTPDDTHYVNGNLWGMYGAGTAPANKYGSGAGEAWAAGHVGTSATYVGIIDEGIKTTHPDLAPNIWSNPWETPNGVDDDGNGYVDDIHGWDFYHDDASVFDGNVDDHGTHVAGTIGARGGNGTGVAGVNWKVTLISAKFLGPDEGFVSDAIRAIDYITDLKTRHGLDIVATNNSWSGGDYSQGLIDAIDRAGDAGILFIAAAGNDGRDIDVVPEYPAAYRCITHADGTPRGWDCILSVANLQSDGTRRGSSNWGAEGVDLGAPGTSIISTVPKGTASYAYYTGTSMAAPHVTGATALCASLKPSRSARQIRDLVLATGRATPSMAGMTVSGERLDVGALASRCAPSEPTPTPTPKPTPTPTPKPTPTPTPKPTPTPTLPPTGASLIVDELDPTFRRTGDNWSDASSGYGKHHYWVATRSGKPRHSGAWKPILATPGFYEVVLKFPAVNATSRKARYRIKTADGWVTRVRSQKKRAGEWVSLGVHRLTTSPIVKLVDATGESGSLHRRLAFDAARFVPTIQPGTRASSPKRRNTTRRAEPRPTRPSRTPGSPSADEPRNAPVRPNPTGKPETAQPDLGSSAEPSPTPTPTAHVEGDNGRSR